MSASDARHWVVDQSDEEQLHGQLSDLLAQVERLFLGPTKVTLIVRTPRLKDGGVVMGNDDLDQAISEIQRLRGRPPFPGGRP